MIERAALWALAIAGWGGAIALSLAALALIAIWLFCRWLEHIFSGLFPAPWWQDDRKEG